MGISPLHPGRVTADDHGMRKPSWFLVALVLAAGASTGAAALTMTSELPTGMGLPSSSAVTGTATNTSPTPVTEPSPASTAIIPVEDMADVEVLGNVATAVPTASATPAPIAEKPLDSVPGLPADIAVEDQFESQAAFAGELMERMNEARVDAGLTELSFDAGLLTVATVRVQDLINGGYFDHYAPNGSSAFSELGARGITYGLAGENLARNTYPDVRSVQAAFDALMGSPAHRANILEPRFEDVAVAAVKTGKTWYYVTIFKGDQ
jgi:uncharacterized protein YkwD